MFTGKQLTSATESISMSTDAPGLKGHFTHAANIEIASDRSNHDRVLAARLTRSGGFFHRIDLLLGAVRQHVSALTTIPTSLDNIRAFAASLALLTTFGLGLRSSRGSTHTYQMTNLPTFSPRFVRVWAVCRSVMSVSAPRTCLLSLIVTFASSFRSLATLARFPLAHGSNVHRSRLCLSHGNTPVGRLNCRLD